MAKPLAALLAAGFSAALIAVSAAAHAVPAPIADPGEKASALQQEQAKDNLAKWSKIADGFCSGEKFSDQGIRDYYEAYKLTPLQYRNNVHPADEARRALMGPDRKYAPPLGSTDADELRHWQRLMCSSAEFKADWANAYKTYEEQLGTKMKPGMDEEEAILELYDKKMEMMLKVLAKENGEGPADDEED
ncbi:hypothetical protein NONI108955_34900 [Nocardia ninae]|uniref:Uncharacterized protein n=1 Tax=Nocardia ninae NBRC 108245 TaxID=1210091 RepID=A0A511MF62_9NOCA|nr:hypothetical protein [Nocardia ninae]GEM39051.1 hypothetical protein NN4_35700 [Nocardia ninae NBRC 108245]